MVSGGIGGLTREEEGVAQRLCQFGEGPGADEAAAQGHFVHVYVERATRRPVRELPPALRRALEPLLIAPRPEEDP